MTPAERRPAVAHSEAATTALVQQFPALRQSAGDVRQFVQALEYVVDVGMVLVCPPRVSSLLLLACAGSCAAAATCMALRARRPCCSDGLRSVGVSRCVYLIVLS